MKEYPFIFLVFALFICGCIGNETKITTSSTVTTTTLREYTGPYKEAVELLKTNVDAAIECCDSLNHSSSGPVCNKLTLILACKLTLMCEIDKNQRESLCKDIFTMYPERCDKLILACESIDEAINSCGDDDICLGRSAFVRALNDPYDALKACDRIKDLKTKVACYAWSATIVKENGGSWTKICERIKEKVPKNVSDDAIEVCKDRVISHKVC